MSTPLRARTLFVASCLVAACSTSTAATNNLVGTWFAQVTDPSTDNQTATATFRADLSYTLIHTQVDSSSSTTPGCLETQTDVGTYVFGNSSGMMTLSLSPNAAMSGVVVRSGCTNATDDGMTTGTPFPLNGTYAISGNMLTIGSGTSAITFTRR